LDYPGRSSVWGPLVLPYKFLQDEIFSVDQIINKFYKIIDTPAFSLPSKHNAGHQLLYELPAHLLHTPLIWVCRSGIIPPLQRPHDDPYAVLHRSQGSFTFHVGTRDKVVSTSRLGQLNTSGCF
jgi:hypothetical protein